MAASGSTMILAPFWAASRMSGSSPLRFSVGLPHWEMNWMAATRTVFGGLSAFAALPAGAGGVSG